jgi:hypothetical protein
MPFSQHHIDDMPGLLLTTTMLFISFGLEIIGTAISADHVVQLVMHCLQSIAALTAVLVGISTVSPKFKERLQKLFNL